MTSTRIAIVGFTSRLARLIADKLLQKPGVEIVGICRNPSKVPESLSVNPRVKVWEVESTDIKALQVALDGVSACVCCYLGDDSLMINGQKVLIDACIAAKVQRYFASDFSFDFRNLALGELPHKDYSLKIMKYLQDKGKAGEIKAVHILNGGFHEAFLSGYMGVLNIEPRKIRYWGEGDESWQISSIETTAEFTAEVLADPDAVGVLRVCGDTVSAKGLGRVIQNVYGIEFQYERLGSVAELHQKLKNERAARPNEPFLWLGLAYNYFTINRQTLMSGSDNDRFPGFEAESLENFCLKHRLEDLPDLYAASAKLT